MNNIEKEEILNLIKENLSLSISKRCSNVGNQLRIAILLESEEIAYDYIYVNEIID